MAACLILAILPCWCEVHEASMRTANLAAAGDLTRLILDQDLKF